MSLRPRTLGLTLVAAALLTVTVACSSSDGPDGSIKVDGPVVTIGVIAPIDGGLTAYGRGIANSVQLAVDEANARNAIPGYSIAVEALDDSSDPAVGEAAAETLAADPSVVGVVGTYNSGVAAVVQPVLAAADIVMVSPGNTDPVLSRGADPVRLPERSYDNYFRLVATDLAQGAVLAQYASLDLGAATTAVVTEPKSVSAGLARDFSAVYEAGGGSIVSFTTLPDDPAAYDLPGVAATVASESPDLVFLGGEYRFAGEFAKALDAAGYTGPVMGGDGMKDDANITAVGSAADDDVASSVGVPNSQLDAPEFFAAYEAAGFDDPPSDFGPYAYDAANVIIAAAAEALAGTTDGVTPAVRAEVVTLVQATDTAGITGPVAFDEFGDTTTRQFTVYRVEGGVWIPSVTRQVAQAAPVPVEPTTE